MARLRCSPALAILAVAAGCGTTVETAGTAGSTGSGGSGSSGGPPADVSGTMVYTYVSDGAETMVPVTGLSIQIQVPGGGTWATFEATTGADGSFVVPGVPEGPFVVVLQGELVYTSARTLDLGVEVGSRLGVVYSAVTPTDIANDIQDLAPWSTAADYLEWFSPNTGGETFSFDGASPPDGATSLTGQTTDWYGNGLLDGSMGDELFVSQIAAQEGPGGATVSTVVRSASFTGIEQTDGMETTVSGTFGAVSPDQTLSLDLHAQELAALAPAVSPKAQDLGVGVYVTTAPGMSKYGILGFSADVLDVSLPPGSGETQLPGLSFGDPYPASWGLVASVYEDVGVSLTAPGASMPTTVYAGASVVGLASTLAGGPIVPKVSPVLDPRVGGASAFAPVQGATTTPVLSWSPPKLGAPSGYRVTLYQLSNTAGATTQTFVATLTTAETTFPIPPGLLTSGSAYFAYITATVTPVDLSSRPFQSVPDYASADVVTDVIQP
jgi:hypothetical protein